MTTDKRKRHARFNTERLRLLKEHDEALLTVHGAVSRALCHGDREALRVFCGHAARALRSGDPLDTYTREALALMLDDMAAGATPNDATGYARSGGRPKDWEIERRDLELAIMANNMIAANVKPDDAFAWIAEHGTFMLVDRGRGSVEPDTVRAAYKKFYKKSR